MDTIRNWLAKMRKVDYHYMVNELAAVTSKSIRALMVSGRVSSKRIFGGKLAFLELATSNSFSSKIASTNIKLKMDDMTDDEGNPLEPEAIKKWYKIIQRGDWLCGLHYSAILFSC